MTKRIDFENVYLEYPDALEEEDKEEEKEQQIRLTKEELERRLEETQSLHL